MIMENVDAACHVRTDPPFIYVFHSVLRSLNAILLGYLDNILAVQKACTEQETSLAWSVTHYWRLNGKCCFFNTEMYPLLFLSLPALYKIN